MGLITVVVVIAPWYFLVIFWKRTDLPSSLTAAKNDNKPKTLFSRSTGTKETTWFRDLFICLLTSRIPPTPVQLAMYPVRPEHTHRTACYNPSMRSEHLRRQSFGLDGSDQHGSRTTSPVLRRLPAGGYYYDGARNTVKCFGCGRRPDQCHRSTCPREEPNERLPTLGPHHAPVDQEILNSPAVHLRQSRADNADNESPTQPPTR